MKRIELFNVHFSELQGVRHSARQVDNSRPAIQNIKDMTYYSEEHIHEVVFAYLQVFSDFAQSTYGVNISAGTITDNIMRNLKGTEE